MPRACENTQIHLTIPSSLFCSLVPLTLPSSCSRRNQLFLLNNLTCVILLSSSVTPKSLKENIFRFILAADHCTAFNCRSADFVRTHSFARQAVISFICALSSFASMENTSCSSKSAILVVYLARTSIASLKLSWSVQVGYICVQPEGPLT